MIVVLEKIDNNNRIKIFEKYGKTEENVYEDVEILMSWAKSQPHLPVIPSKNMIVFFLINNKFSIELTKTRLDMYYTIRSIMPDFYKIINPKYQRMKVSFETSYIFPLPKLVNNLDRVFFIKFKNVPDEQIDIDGLIGKTINIQEVRIQEDLMVGHHVVLDCEHLTLQLALKFTPTQAKMCATILEKVYSNRIKEIHVINFHPVANILLKLAKLALKPKLIDRIRMHETLDSFRKQIPLAVLPKDYGGHELSLDEIQDLWRKKFIEYGDRFDKLDVLEVKQELRPTPMENIECFGVQGTFKKLNID